jgi:hypothetical protein
VQVLLDRCQVSVQLRPHRALIYQNAWIDLWDVVHYKEPNSKFRYVCNPDACNRDRNGYLAKQLTRLAKVMRQHCSDMLHGDFDLRESLEQFRKERRKRNFGDALSQ